jgi:hypothetical protein
MSLPSFWRNDVFRFIQGIINPNVRPRWPHDGPPGVASIVHAAPLLAEPEFECDPGWQEKNVLQGDIIARFPVSLKALEIADAPVFSGPKTSILSVGRGLFRRQQF